MSEDRVAQLSPGITADNFRAINKGSVVGSIDVTISAWKLKISCLWIKTDKAEFIALPSQAWTNQAGKRIYKPLVEITNIQVSQRFQRAALAAAQKARNSVSEELGRNPNDPWALRPAQT